MLTVKSQKIFQLISLCAVFICTLLVYSPITYATSITQEYVKIPAKFDDGVYHLEAMIYRPNGAGVYPLIVINHGRSTKPAERKIPTLVNYYKTQAETLAQKGFAVVVAVRRGYGNSEGSDVEYSTASTIYQAGLQGAKDVTEIVRFMQSQPYIDKNRVILIGQSCGGLVSVASGTKDIPGLIGVVNFAGGLRHPSTANPSIWTTADETYLVKTYHSYGQNAKVPMLWIYTENDHFFPSDLSPKMYDAFIKGGGTGKFYLLPPFGKDGHTFFPNKSTIPTWMPLFDEFLKTLNVPTSNL
ncbi:dienelactone hydrolase [Sporomusaceae bacterium BoRhaA]|uniref:alpha/beta hydrolase family protein n=1 Tax=Pelorhabdus rhamnosifermentans TaxID=2772457 RepID=UPI001C064622|nr:alpha/beta hydrolase [Pelorhabdus rhamnosifermentans]MBU2702439.1 dienelactone hydrolase [Pelorhabdus rhamnosifermentans]